MTPLVEGDSQFITLFKYTVIFLLFAFAIFLTPFCVLWPWLDKQVWVTKLTKEPYGQR